MRVSAVVPTYRRPELLRRCLDALLRQDLDGQCYEIIVADDAACEHSKVEIETLARSAEVSLRYVSVTGRHGPAAARNAGWRAARGSIIAFTDDDCVPDRTWLAAALVTFDERPDVAAVTGRTVVPLPEPPTDYERDTAGLERAEFVTANCFCRREVLEAIGGFDERFTAAWREDSDLHFALLSRQQTVVHAPRAVVLHPVRPAPWGISLRQQRKCLFDALLFKKYPALFRKHIQPSTPWDYYIMVVALTLGLLFAVSGLLWPALVCALVWLLLLSHFLLRRLCRTSRRPTHVAEMLVTSPLIPFLSVFWRLYGAYRFRVLFM